MSKRRDERVWAAIDRDARPLRLSKSRPPGTFTSAG